MAQNVTIAGASYSAVPSIIVPKTGGGTASFVDTSDADATAEDIVKDKVAYVNGIRVVGTLEGGGGGTLYTFTLPSDAYVRNASSGDIVSAVLGGTPLQIVFTNASIKAKATVTVDDYSYWNIFTAKRLQPGDMTGYMMTPVFYMPASNITAVLN